ncbi:ABC transporter permease [Gordonia sp. DT219]|uniref:ABC transporter permease n=1 Tax=Gordonia sp. DT219 TaxID=3416658 RepID=UPI003CFAAE12
MAITTSGLETGTRAAAPADSPDPQPAGRPPASVSTVQGTERIHAALDKVTRPIRVDPLLVGFAVLAWGAFAAIVAFAPHSDALALRDVTLISRSSTFTATAGVVVAGIGVALWVLSTLDRPAGKWASRRLSHSAAWLAGSAVWMIFWEVSTATTALLEPPYFVSPQAILSRLWEDRVILGESLGNSLQLLVVGFVAGLIAGVATGVVIGWWQSANYWVHPVLIFLGPVPTLAWVPIVFVLFPTAYSGAVFLIALSVWFPLTVVTRAGIVSVPKSYFDVAQTLGADNRFLVLRVSLPGALPSIFTGAFMGLCSSFVSLTVAENFGVNSGLGWYLNWKKGWGDFPGVYAGLVVLIVVCGLLLVLLFRLRERTLRWEKELTRW